MVHHYFESSLVVEDKSKQHLDPLMMKLKEWVCCKINESFYQGDDVLRYQERLCMPFVVNFRSRIRRILIEPVTLFIQVIQRFTITYIKYFCGMS